MCIYIYIYIERERDIYYIYTHIHVYIYIYIYIYRDICSPSAAARQEARATLRSASPLCFAVPRRGIRKNKQLLLSVAWLDSNTSCFVIFWSVPPFWTPDSVFSWLISLEKAHAWADMDGSTHPNIQLVLCTSCRVYCVLPLHVRFNVAYSMYRACNHLIGTLVLWGTRAQRPHAVGQQHNANHNRTSNRREDTPTGTVWGFGFWGLNLGRSGVATWPSKVLFVRPISVLRFWISEGLLQA